MNLFQDEDRRNLITQLKKSAPSIARMYCAKRLYKLNSTLYHLRLKYKNTNDTEKRKQIADQADRIKKEMEMYKANL